MQDAEEGNHVLRREIKRLLSEVMLAEVGGQSVTAGERGAGAFQQRDAGIEAGIGKRV